MITIKFPTDHQILEDRKGIGLQSNDYQTDHPEKNLITFFKFIITNIFTLQINVELLKLKAIICVLGCAVIFTGYFFCI